VWTEKDALAGVLVEVTVEYDVPLMVSRGFASVSYLPAPGRGQSGREVPYQAGEGE
jgi:hypothetical protein